MRLIIIILFLFPFVSFAQCVTNGYLNPMSDVAWEETFPIVIGGVTVAEGSGGIAGFDNAWSKSAGSQGFCLCGSRIGLPIGMSSVISAGEVVEDPMCMPTMNAKDVHVPVSSAMRGFGQKAGSDPAGSDKGSRKIFSFVHIDNYNPMALMKMFEDLLKMGAVQSTGLDIAYFSEISPTSTNSETANFEFPETLLLSNPITVASCMADSVTTTYGDTIDTMFWCAGGHSIFPTSHFTVEGNSYQDAQDIQIVKGMNAYHRIDVFAFSSTRGKEAVTACGIPIILPYPKKSEFKFQRAKPFNEMAAHRMGKPSPLWNTPRKDIQGTTVTLIWQREDFCGL